MHAFREVISVPFATSAFHWLHATTEHAGVRPIWHNANHLLDDVQSSPCKNDLLQVEARLLVYSCN